MAAARGDAQMHACIVAGLHHMAKFGVMTDGGWRVATLAQQDRLGQGRVCKSACRTQSHRSRDRVGSALHV